MTLTLQAIETRYKGYRFRSRLEARWAVFFDALGIAYEYEKEGYNLGGTPYLCDFWLPEYKYWIEIKGDQPTDAELAKAEKLFEGSGFPTIVFHGTPGSHPGAAWYNCVHDSSGGTSSSDEVKWYRCILCGEYDTTLRCKGSCTVLDAHDWALVGLCLCDFDCYPFEAKKNAPKAWVREVSLRDFGSVGLMRAFEAARSARFEHGESGAPGSIAMLPVPVSSPSPPSLLIPSEPVLVRAQNQWELIKQVCKQKSRRVAVLLDSARPVLYHPGESPALVIQADFKTNQCKHLREAANRAVIEWAIQQVLEQSIRVKIVPGEFK